MQASTQRRPRVWLSGVTMAQVTAESGCARLAWAILASQAIAFVAEMISPFCWANLLVQVLRSQAKKESWNS